MPPAAAALPMEHSLFWVMGLLRLSDEIPSCLDVINRRTAGRRIKTRSADKRATYAPELENYHDRTRDIVPHRCDDTDAR